MMLNNLFLLSAGVMTFLSSDNPQTKTSAASPAVADAPPILHWSFAEGDFSGGVAKFELKHKAGSPILVAAGPSVPEFPRFAAGNTALQLDGRSWLVFADPGDNSSVDFTNGDSISVEAWVRVSSIDEGQQVYLVGKGRTNNPDTSPDNQNWALRLRGMGGSARLSFLFRSRDVATTTDADANIKSEATTGEFHRWNSEFGFPPDDQWHHVAVSFTFGESSPPIAWIDGQPTDGSWDMGGKTFTRPPVVDDDEVWIGSSMGGNPGSSLRGLIDELSVFRRVLTDSEIQARFQTTRRSTALSEVSNDRVPQGTVFVDLREFVRQSDPWDRNRTRITMQWEQPVAAMTALPRKYGSSGLIDDRTNPTILRMRCLLNSSTVTTQFLIRARSSARLLIDGQEVAVMHQAPYASDGHQEVPVPPEPLYPSMHPVPAGDQETVVSVPLTSGTHLVEFETVIGGRNMRVEASETLVAMGSPERGFEILSPSDISFRLTEQAWLQFAADYHIFLRDLEQRERLGRGAEAAEFWNCRHEIARQLIREHAPEGFSSNLIDQMLEQTRESTGLSPLPIVDDLTFLRRLALNTVGIIPSRDEIAWFLKQPEVTRRSAAIDRFLNDPRWADHWVSYWQDVLAENPGILKPELNNTGPFRWWIHESFLDNKPMDRFATELVMMKGSRLGGGPAGFAMATQNDVPLAERALVLSAAFNARDMKCARCHDSPVNDLSQRQLFELAAMLNRAPITIPSTSSVPKGPDGKRSKLITVSIEPGTTVTPGWPFANRGNAHDPSPWHALLMHPEDPREQAALHLTHPTESPFAEVMVNRLWARLFGRGLIPDTENWHESPSDHSELLAALARQHIACGYDLKSTARLIFNTQAWQRQAAPEDSPAAKAFGAVTMRRMSAEQMLDSLYAAVGKTFDAEMLTLDPEGRRPESTFLNLGVPRRAWEFCSLSNERDRPALALPVAQSLVDLLSVFGWRDSRPNGAGVRDNQATVLQPLTLANGNAGHRLVQLSDHTHLTELAIETSVPEDLVRHLFRQVLTRDPSDDEIHLFAEELQPGFDDRVVPGATRLPLTSRRNAVSWSNHLHREATRIKQEQEEAARRGDPPTLRLTEAWRLRAEDVLWVLLNSPEFAFVP